MVAEVSPLMGLRYQLWCAWGAEKDTQNYGNAFLIIDAMAIKNQYHTSKMFGFMDLGYDLHETDQDCFWGTIIVFIVIVTYGNMIN